MTRRQVVRQAAAAARAGGGVHRAVALTRARRASEVREAAGPVGAAADGRVVERGLQSSACTVGRQALHVSHARPVLIGPRVQRAAYDTTADRETAQVLTQQDDVGWVSPVAHAVLDDVSLVHGRADVVARVERGHRGAVVARAALDDVHGHGREPRRLGSCGAGVPGEKGHVHDATRGGQVRPLHEAVTPHRGVAEVEGLVEVTHHLEEVLDSRQRLARVVGCARAEQCVAREEGSSAHEAQLLRAHRDGAAPDHAAVALRLGAERLVALHAAPAFVARAVGVELRAVAVRVACLGRAGLGHTGARGAGGPHPARVARARGIDWPARAPAAAHLHGGVRLAARAEDGVLAQPARVERIARAHVVRCQAGRQQVARAMASAAHGEVACVGGLPRRVVDERPAVAVDRAVGRERVA